MNSNYYVYALLNPLKPGKFIYGKYVFEYEPFYIGKGRNKRIYYHSSKNKSDTNRLKINILLKIKSSGLKPIRIKLIENITELKSYSIEKKLIDLIGMRISASGPLSNMTLGGNGVSGYIHTESTRKKISEVNKGKIISDDHKKKISEANKGRIYSTETRKKISVANKGRIRTDEHKKKISVANKGKIISEEHKEKLSVANSGKNNPFYNKKHTKATKRRISSANKGNIPHNIGKNKVLQFDSNNNLIRIWDNLKQLVEATGFPKSNICRSIKKGCKCMGYNWRYI